MFSREPILSDSVNSVLPEDREILGIMAEGARTRCVRPMKPEQTVVSTLGPETLTLQPCDLCVMSSHLSILDFPPAQVGSASRHRPSCSAA